MYNDERYGKQDFKFSQNLSEIDRRKLSTYTAGTIRANQKLLELKQFLKTVDRPTILLVFGDHLPNLQGVYDNYNFFKDDPERKNLKNYQTPLQCGATTSLVKKRLSSRTLLRVL